MNFSSFFLVCARATHTKTLAGTTNAPEYYINMRTGTHYFPRGVTGVAAVERNCQKFGLNKIEETAGESAIATTLTTSATASHTTIFSSNHRRTESYDLGKSKLKTTSLASLGPTTATTTIRTSNDHKTSVIAMQTMSPEVQRRLAYQNYRGFECKCEIKLFFIYSPKSDANDIFCFCFAHPRTSCSSIAASTMSHTNESVAFGC